MPTRKTTRTQAPGSWVKIHTGLPRHPKITSAGKPGALALALVAICLAADAKTDGEFDLDFAVREACTDQATAKALIANDFFHPFGHDCKKCPQPRHKGLHVVHDYLEWQRPGKTVSELSDTRRANGSIGGIKRRDNIRAAKAAAEAALLEASKRLAAETTAPEEPAAKPVRRRKPKVDQQVLVDHGSGSTSYPGTLASSETGTQPSETAKTEAEMKLDADIDAVCDYLANKIQQRKGKRPKISQSGWINPARLLLTKDTNSKGGKGYSVEQIRYVIDWCTNEETSDGRFWAKQILSIDALRRRTADGMLRFDQFRDAIQIAYRNRGRNNNTPSAGHRNVSHDDRERADEEFLATFGRGGATPHTTQEELWAA